MRSTIVLIGTIALTIALAGCGVNHLKRGHEAYDAGNYDSAVYHYESAIAKKPELEADPVFSERVREARTLQQYEHGVRLTQRGAYESALPRFEQALAITPDFQPAAQALSQAKLDAARALYDEAIGLADIDQIERTQPLLRRALNHDPNHAGAAAALDSLAGDDPTDPAAPLFTQALEMARARKWRQAADTLRAARQANPHHLLVRGELHRAQLQLDRASALTMEGRTLLDEKRLDDAIARLNASLAVWPHDADAVAMRDRAMELREQSEEAYREAGEHFAARRWDSALTVLGTALRIYPTHRNALALRERTLGAAAADYTQRGRTSLAASQLDGAEDAFRRAMHYIAGHAPARQGMADVAYLRGEADLQAGRPGHAMLQYMTAMQWSEDQRYELAIRDARRRIVQRIAYDVSLEVLDTSGRQTTRSDMVGDQLFAAARRMASDQVAITPNQADYNVTLSIDQFTITERRVDSVNREHTYTVTQTVANPRLRELRREVADLANAIRITRLEYEEAQRRCRREHLKQTPAKGKGDRVTCIHCNSVDRLDRKLRDLHRHLDRCKDAIRRTPALVDVRSTQVHPYVIHTHEKTGRLRVVGRIDDARTGALIQRIDITRNAGSEDTAIEGAAPDLGLAGDPLELPTDDEIAAKMTRAVGSAAAGDILAQLAIARARQLQREADQFAQAGRHIDAMEASIAAAIAIEPANRDEAERRLATLRQ